MSSASSRRESLVGTSSHVLCSTVIAAPATAVVRALRSIDSIKRYGVDGRVIGCSVMENTVPPDEVGAVRRCTLLFAPYLDAILREKLLRYTDDVHAVDEPEPAADASDSAAGDEAATKVTEIVLGYVPCSAGEQHRSPFTPDVDAVLRSATTTFRVSGVSRSINRCYVEAVGNFSLGAHGGTRVPLEDRLRDTQHRRDVHEFWSTYLDAQLHALEAHVVKEVHQRLDDRLPAELGAAFHTHEDVLCAWAAETHDVLPRDVVAVELEQVLVWWSRTLRECQHQRLLAEASSATPSAPRPAGQNGRGDASGGAWPQQGPSPTPPVAVSASSGSCGANQTQRHGAPFGSPSSTHDKGLPRYRPQSGLVSAVPAASPAPPGHTTSSTPAMPSPQSVGVSDSRRTSVPSPRDRRHTAAPDRSNQGSEPASDVLPPIALTSGNLPTPVSVPSLTAAPVVLPPTVVMLTTAPFASPVQRRRSVATPHTSHTSHILSRAATNSSRHGSFHSRSGPPRTSQLLQTAAAAPTHERSGLFFSQLLHSTPGTTGGGVAAVVHSASATTATATPGTASAAAPPGVEDFHPGLVRHLFSLTGVLQEDVARRLFFSLCDDPTSAAPWLSSAAMRRILQCVDPCGLRESKLQRSGRQATAIAEDEEEEEAYRAEVRRCYYEQQQQQKEAKSLEHHVVDGATEKRRPLLTISTTPGLVHGRSAASANDASASTSVLNRLAARQQASRQAREEAALDKVVQSTMTRFGFHKKSALTYDEFCLAVLHLWKN